MYTHHRFAPPPPPLSVPAHLAQQIHPYNLPPMSSTPTSSSQQSPRTEKSKEEDLSDLPGPPPMTTLYDDKVWALDIAQQPVRARMCGFGDKDRRPITPPPCIRLIIMDPNTKQEIPINDVDTSYFVITVDLWDVNAEKEVNLCRHAQANSPAISNVTTLAYSQTISNPSPGQPAPRPYDVSSIPAYSQQTFASPVSAQPPSSTNTHCPPSSAHSSFSNGVPPYPMHPQYSYDQRYGPPPAFPNGYGQGHPASSYSSQNSNPMISPYSQQPPDAIAPGSAGMFTRNLIGSLTASAFRLLDTQDRIGIWFVLQDLSVRTEGWFRLKINFVNVGQAVTRSSDAAPGSNGTAPHVLARNTAPVLASIFSKPFQVFSAKKFPGVIESTELSRSFASQGIKIPIRKDPAPTNGRTNGNKQNNMEDDDADDED